MFKIGLFILAVFFIVTSCGGSDTPQNKDLCEDIVCLNDGVCEDGKCICSNGYEGDNCENTVNLCENIDCDDGNSCTDDNCNPETGECVYTNNNNPCDDKDPYTINEVCDNGICGGGVTIDCIGDSDCNDSNVCTDDICDSGNCRHDSLQGISCDDGYSCTIDDICDDSKCRGELLEGYLIEDNKCVETVVDYCNPNPCLNGGLCNTDSNANGYTCDCSGTGYEGNNCENTIDLCENTNCDDGNSCTDDNCNPITGECIHINNNNICDDGYSCTVSDSCHESVCMGELIDGYLLSNGQCIEIRPFVTEWKTDNEGISGNTEVTINTNNIYNSYTYNYSIDCNYNGVYFNATATEQTGDYTCSYDVPGTYMIAIRGEFPKTRFDYNNSDAKKLLKVVQWGDIHWLSMERAFAGCSNMIVTATDVPDLSEVTNISGMFTGASSFNSDISNWDVSNVTNMASLFQLADNFNQPLNSWNVSNVTNMRMMFYMASKFDKPLDNWSVSNVTDMKSMFESAYDFNQDISNWSVCNVTNYDNFDRHANSWDEINKPDFTCQ